HRLHPNVYKFHPGWGLMNETKTIRFPSREAAGDPPRAPGTCYKQHAPNEARRVMITIPLGNSHPLSLEDAPVVHSQVQQRVAGIDHRTVIHADHVRGFMGEHLFLKLAERIGDRSY